MSNTPGTRVITLMGPGVIVAVGANITVELDEAVKGYGKLIKVTERQIEEAK